MADLSASDTADTDAEIDFELLLDDSGLAWRLAQEARSNGKWALASRLVRVAREAEQREAV